MGRSKQSLERTYKSYSDDELLNMYSKGILTELAQEVMKDEINKRGLTVSEKIESITRDPSIVRDPENKSSLEIASFGLLRLFRGIVGFMFGWQIVGLIPVLTWLSNPSAITGEMIGLTMLKVTMMIVFGLIFFGLRKVIHWLHNRWYGSPHPSLAKALAL